MKLLPFVLLSSLFALGCGRGGLAASDEAVDEANEAIIGGSPDTAHPAAVAVFAPDFLCTGSILQVKGNIGYVITAGHCCPEGDFPNEVVIGADYNKPDKTFAVVPGSVHPDYGFVESALNNGYDFCMLRFSGADASTPTMPPLTPDLDDLAANSTVEIVGFGMTMYPSSSNTLRNHVNKVLTAVDTTLLYFQHGNTGTCFGDSGGPWLASVGGKQYVGGVTSFGKGETCPTTSAGGRLSAVYDTLVQPYLEDKEPALSCGECRSGSLAHNCQSTLAACTNDPTCGQLYNCIQGCKGGGDNLCGNQCLQKYPAKPGLLGAIAKCQCNDCTAQCSVDPQCNSGGSTTSSGGGPAPVKDTGCAVSAPSDDFDPAYAAAGLFAMAGVLGALRYRKRSR